MEDLVHTEVDVTVLKPSGNLSGPGAAGLKEEIRGHLEGGSHVVLDMSEVSFTDSEGLSTLVAAFKSACASSRRFALASVRQNLRALLELTRLHRVFEFHEDPEAAIAAIRGSGGR